ncbi:MAG: hypothetical protein QXN21_05605, partial [Candidatus Bathyarchaeia archaeon]
MSACILRIPEGTDISPELSMIFSLNVLLGIIVRPPLTLNPLSNVQMVPEGRRIVTSILGTTGSVGTSTYAVEYKDMVFNE